MWKRLLILGFVLTALAGRITAQEEWEYWYYDVSDEERMAYWMDRMDELSELQENPININTATKEQLEQLPFLSDRMVEAILYYVYKYGPLVSKNEMIAVEGMDQVTRALLDRFIYIGKGDTDLNKLRWKNIRKYNKQELTTRLDIPLNMKAGYADYPDEVLAESPNKKYLGDRFYHNVRYRFSYSQQLFAGLTAEKDAGEPFFCKFNRKGYDSYTGYLFLQNVGRIKQLAVGNYRAAFGYGLVMNVGAFGFGKQGMESVQRGGRGFSKYSSMAEGEYLQGAAATIQLKKRWYLSAAYSYRKRDANVDGMFIRSLKTDGYHRLIKDVEKKNTINNNLILSNLSYNGTKVEAGVTAVYNSFDRVLNPTLHDYNRYYPRGRQFFNIGGYYKLFFDKFIFSGETAADKSGHFATLNMLSYAPNTETCLFLINRFYDKAYQCVTADAFGENSKMQNEVGTYIGLDSRILGRIKCTAYLDLFHFFYRKYRVDKDHTSGIDASLRLAYQHNNELSVFIKYGYKQKASNYTSANDTKLVVPAIRQRVQAQCVYAPTEKCSLKTCAEFVHSAYYRYEHASGGYVSEILKVELPRFPLKLEMSETWFRTQDYDARVYVYEPGLLYAFSIPSFYGRGNRMTVGMKYTWKDRCTIQAKWGWTHYFDRNTIGTSTEEIQGSDKADLQVQLRIKW